MTATIHTPLLERAAGSVPEPHDGPHVTPVVWAAIAGDPKLSWNAKGILLYMATRLHAHPVELAELLAVAQDSRTNVTDGLAELETTGWIRTVHRPGKADGWLVNEDLESPPVEWPQRPDPAEQSEPAA